MKKVKKGFTLLELVIVIAVVGVLTAILVPTFASLIKKAKITNDVMIVKNLNTAMQNEENLNVNTDYDMMYKVIEAVNNQGYSLEKLTPTAQGYSIVWDQNTNRFALLDEKGKVNYQDANFKLSENKYLWKVCKTKSEIETAGKTYSVYIGGNNEIGEITVNNSIDVGDSLTVSEINYINQSNNANTNVIIKTNSINTKLVINAPLDTVYHYNDVMNVHIVAVDSNSYHEYGNVAGNVSIESGHVQIEKNATVGSMILETKSQGNNATAIPSITATVGSEIGTVVINNSDAEIKVNEGAKIALVAPGTNVTVDASKVSGVTVSKDKIDTTNSSTFAGGFGTSKAPYLITNVEQLKNMIDGASSKSNCYYKLNNDLILSNKDFKDKDYKVGYFDILVKGLIYIVFDGNNKTISFENVKNGHYAIFDNLVGVTIKNLNMITTSADKSFSSVSIYNANVTFDNVNVSGNAKFDDNNLSFYAMYSTTSKTLTFKNCNCSANFQSSKSYNAIFIGQAGYNSKSYFTNCTYSGKFVSPQAAMFIANAFNGKVTLSVTNCFNKGQIISTSPNSASNDFCAASCTKVASLKVDSVTVKSTSDAKFNQGYGFVSSVDSKFSVTRNNSNIKIVKANDSSVKYYIISVSAYAKRIDGNIGTNLISAFSEKISADDFNEDGTYTDTSFYKPFTSNTSYTKTDKSVYATFVASESKLQVVTNNNVEYYLYADSVHYFEKDTTPSTITISAIDENGNVLYSVSTK